MRVQVDGVRLFFDVEGAGLVPDGPRMVVRPTVVLLHGGPDADHSLYKPWMSPLADAAQLVYLDLRGSGRSDRGDPADWEWDRWGDDVAAFCEALDIRSPVLLGTSCGAWVALMCALDHPRLVRGLVLDSAMPATHEQTLAVFERTGSAKAVSVARRFFAGDISDEISAAWVDHCLPLYTRRHPEAVGPDALERVERNPDVELRLRNGQMTPFDAWDRLGDITCPTLVLAGEDDPATPLGEALRLTAALSNAPVQLETYADCGHGVFREVPDDALTTTRHFLAHLPPT